MNMPYTTFRTTILIAIISHIIPLNVTASEIDFLLKRIISLETRVSQLEQQTSKAQPQAINKAPTSTQILGAWQAQDEYNTIVNYFSDGRFSMAARGRQMTGSWVILPDGRLKIEVSGFGQTMTQVGTIHFDNNDLIITDENSTVGQRHKRIR